MRQFDAPVYYPDIFIASRYFDGSQSSSEIALNFDEVTYVSDPIYLPTNSVVMSAFDYVPCIEAKLPKGTYTFQATASPINGLSVSGSTPGAFMFETCTAGIWTVQFNLALPKAEGATRTLTFAHDTRVRWLLTNTGGQTATALITARYYNSGS
jgi:hypothetical protein